MLIAALNIRSGGGLRVDALLQHIIQSDPDIIVLTEWRDNLAGRKIAQWAQKRGMHFASCTDGATANGICVASKFPLSEKSQRPADPGAGVLLEIKFDHFTMLACYFPQGRAKQPFFDRCETVASEHAGEPFIIIGDLNTGNQIADKDITGGPYYCASSFDSLSKHAGLHDLWRLSNGANAREWTWMSNGKNGFRIDHALANDAFIQRGKPICRYDHEPRILRITDHSLLFVEYRDLT